MSEETRRKKTRILLADGQDVVRQGIRHILEREPDFEVVGDTDNGQEAVRLARELRPDVIIMEARMSKLDGVEAARRIKEEHPQAAVLIFTACDEEEYVRPCEKSAPQLLGRKADSLWGTYSGSA